MVNLFHRYTEYERDSRDRFYFWRSGGPCKWPCVFWYKCKKWDSSPHQDHDIFWFGIPINLCFLPLLGGGFGIPPQSILVDPLCAQVRYSINFIPSPHVGPSQLWGLRNYLVLPWYLELLYNFKGLTSVCFNTWLPKAVWRKTWFESKLTNHSGLIKFCESRFCCTNILYLIGNLPLNSF